MCEIGLKNRCPHGLVGSNPTAGTQHDRKPLGKRLFPCARGADRRTCGLLPRTAADRRMGLTAKEVYSTSRALQGATGQRTAGYLRLPLSGVPCACGIAGQRHHDRAEVDWSVEDIPWRPW